MPVPYVRVEVAFTTAPDEPVQAWTDISTDVRLADGIATSRGRSDEFEQVNPGRLTLTLDNTAGAYTFGSSNPNVLPGKRIRLLVSLDGETWSPRFDGYVDGWPMAWQSVVEQPRVLITATDRLARFGRLRLLRHPMAEEAGTGVDMGDVWVLAGEVTVPPVVEEGLYPANDLYPSDTLYPA